jgi:Rad51
MSNNNVYVSQVGGHVIAHASTVRLSLRKGKAEQRIMKVLRLQMPLSIKAGRDCVCKDTHMMLASAAVMND